MKSLLLLIPVLSLAFLASSCVRTAMPIDPMTLKPTSRCLPEHFHQVYPTK